MGLIRQMFKKFYILFLAVFLIGANVNVAHADDNTLIVAVTHDLSNMDPTLASGDTVVWEVLTNVYDWLIDYAVVNETSGKRFGHPDLFVGALADHFVWSNDGHTLTFHIRKGLKFSNGDPLDAEAVKFTFDRIYDQGGVTVGNMALSEVPTKDHVRMIDSHTIEMTLDRANGMIFGNMAQLGNAILNPKVVKPHMTADDPYAHEWLANNTQGTEQGPYRMESWDIGNQWVLVRNEHYNREPAKLERIIFKVIPDASSRLAQLVSGAVDIAKDIPTIDIKSVENNPDITIVRNPTRMLGYLGMSADFPPFDNVKVRQAVSYAIPYDTIIDDVLNGYAIPMKSPLPVGTPTHSSEFNQYKHDPEKAKALLAEAGFPNGFKTTLEIPVGSQEAKETAMYVQQSLAEVGVDIDIVELPGAAYFGKIQQHELGFYFANFWISINNDPMYHFYWKFLHACCNYTDTKNDRVNELIEQWTVTTDLVGREKASLEIQKILVDEAAWVYLYHPEQIIAMRSNVKGHVFYPADVITRYKYLYKD